MGENLPFARWRVDNSKSWIPNRHKYAAKKSMRELFSANFYFTTSGNFHTPALLNAISEIGVERVLFSTDWPFENIDHAAMWFDAAPIAENDRHKIGRSNARRLFKLGNE
jgi:2,3-dihydroxybenzoate decarboxylase